MWLNRLAKLRGVLRTLAADPHTQGQAAQVAGVALVADGLVGLENPLDGHKSRVGILGGIFPIVFGLVFFFVPALFEDATPYENGMTTTGTVVSTDKTTTTDSDGDVSTTCSAVVNYEVAGQTYTKETSYYSSSLCGSEGRPIEVSYLPERPADGRVIDSDIGWFTSIFRYIGLFIIATGVLLIVTRLISIVAGAWLWFWGRRRKSQFPKNSDIDWMRLLQEAWGSTGLKGNTVQQPNTLVESITGALTGLTGSDQPPAPQPFQQPSTYPPSHAPSAQSPSYAPPAPQPPPSQGPPAGWYPDPSAPSGKRWWTGSAWLDPS